MVCVQILKKKITQKCRQLGDRVVTTGYIEHENIWKYYQLADIAVLPSMWEEPAGLTILEAISNGLFVVSTNAGGIPEYVDERFCRMLDRSDDFVDKLEKEILYQYNNRNKQYTYSDRRRYIQDNYSETLFYENFIKIIQ